MQDPIQATTMMTIEIVDGSQTVRHLATSQRALDRLAQLSEEAAAEFSSEGGWRIPWRLALQAVSLAEANDEIAARIHEDRPSSLSEPDLETLGVALLPLLPPANNLELRVRKRGLVGSKSAELVTEWRNRLGGVLTTTPHFEHGFWSAPTGEVRLHIAQLAALEALPEPTALRRSRDEGFVAIARFSEALYPHPSLKPVGLLAEEDTTVVPAIQPRLSPVGDGRYQARPAAESVETKSLEDHFYQGRGSILSYRGPDGRRARAVLSERAQRGLQKLREIDQLDAEQAAHAASHPEEAFGPDLDTSKLSERVIGLGPAVRRVHASLREVPKQSWYDWDVVVSLDEVDDSDGPDAPSQESSLKDPELRAKFEAAIARADERGDHLIPDPTGKPGFIEVSQDLRQAIASAKALEASEARDGGQLKKPPRQVLLVHENLERVTFEQALPPSPALDRMPDRPPGLVASIELKPHQVEGFRWLGSLFGEGAPRGRGAMLADDMGLGKTLQVLSLLRWLQEQGRRGPHLVAAPLALLENWQDEASRFFGEAFEPMLTATTKTLPAGDDRAIVRLRNFPLVLVSYETLRRKELVFAQVAWDIVVLDEAQRAKELTSQIFRVVRTLNARGRIAMTGTPVENKLSELWALFDWATPGLLDDARTFQANYTKRLKADPDCAEELAERLLERISPYYRRRMKSEVAKDLPPKVVERTDVELAPEQVAAYGEIARSDAPALRRLARLFGICAHPEMESTNSTLPPAAVRTFPKAEALFARLDEIHGRAEKALIFANRRLLQKWLAEEIEERYETLVDIINGEVSDSRQRLDIIKRFSRVPGFAALVLSPRAAGVGLNITAANHVIHYTREWNPAVENQATDRAYRIGQTRDVFVHYLVSTAPPNRTVEEKLHDLLEDKRRLMTTFVVPMGNLTISPDEME